MPLAELTDANVSIRDTEADIVKILLMDVPRYFQTQFVAVHTEFPTEVGIIDVLGITSDGVYYVAEAKRKTVNIDMCSQLQRYVEHFLDLGHVVVGCMVAPRIGANAQRYCTDRGFRFIQVDFVQ